MTHPRCLLLVLALAACSTTPLAEPPTKIYDFAPSVLADIVLRPAPTGPTGPLGKATIRRAIQEIQPRLTAYTTVAPRPWLAIALGGAAIATVAGVGVVAVQHHDATPPQPVAGIVVGVAPVPSGVPAIRRIAVADRHALVDRVRLALAGQAPAAACARP